MPDTGRSDPNGGSHDPRPVVRLPRQGLPGGIIALLAALVALILFGMLEGQRRARLARPPASETTSAFPLPPPLVMPPEPAPVVAMPEPIETRPAIVAPRPSYAPPIPAMPIPVSPFVAPPAPPPTQPAGSAKQSEPAIVLDTTGPEGATAVTAQSGGGSTAAAGSGDDAPTSTTVIRNRTTVMPTGTMIPAVLETPIDSARPGLVRAIVAEDARGFDGQRVLIPRGSRLIGQYESDVRSGQNRVLVTWTRLIRPDGIAIRIGSPAADALGGAGVPGHVNTFFFERFAGAVLQSALAVGVNLAARPGNNSVIVGLPGSNLGSIGQDLVPGSDLKPKIKVRQGATINIFVAHDLDFSGTPNVETEPAH